MKNWILIIFLSLWSIVGPQLPSDNQKRKDDMGSEIELARLLEYSQILTAKIGQTAVLWIHHDCQ